jgi:mono/diheme cytochrome c family protein
MVQQTATGRRRPWAALASIALLCLGVDHALAAGAAPDGQALYQRHCSVCHGERGAGALWGRAGLNPPPLDFTAAGVGAWLNRDRMVTAVTHGRAGTAMVAFSQRLGSDEIFAVVDYVRDHFMAAAPATPQQPGAASAPAPSDGFPRAQAGRGDAARGAVLYAANCATCHGHGGRGDGPRAYFIFPRPRDFTTEAARATLDRPRLEEAIRHGVRGREMPAWRTVLDDQQIADVAEYVFRVFAAP